MLIQSRSELGIFRCRKHSNRFACRLTAARQFFAGSVEIVVDKAYQLSTVTIFAIWKEEWLIMNCLAIPASSPPTGQTFWTLSSDYDSIGTHIDDSRLERPPECRNGARMQLLASMQIVFDCGFLLSSASSLALSKVVAWLWPSLQC